MLIKTGDAEIIDVVDSNDINNENNRTIDDILVTALQKTKEKNSAKKQDKITES